MTLPPEIRVFTHFIDCTVIFKAIFIRGNKFYLSSEATSRRLMSDCLNKKLMMLKTVNICKLDVYS